MPKGRETDCPDFCYMATFQDYTEYSDLSEKKSLETVDPKKGCMLSNKWQDAKLYQVVNNECLYGCDWVPGLEDMYLIGPGNVQIEENGVEKKVGDTSGEESGTEEWESEDRDVEME